MADATLHYDLIAVGRYAGLAPGSLMPTALCHDCCPLVMAALVAAIGGSRVPRRMAGTVAGHDGKKGPCEGSFG